MQQALGTVDREEPVAFDRTPLSIASHGARGPRMPFSPERTVVPLPGRNPEEDKSLAVASERQSANNNTNQSDSRRSLKSDVSRNHARHLITYRNSNFSGKSHSPGIANNASVFSTARSAVFAVGRCPSHSCMLSKWLKISSNFYLV